MNERMRELAYVTLLGVCAHAVVAGPWSRFQSAVSLARPSRSGKWHPQGAAGPFSLIAGPGSQNM